MRFKKQHTRNGVRYAVGDPYLGPIKSARFLYHRGVLEADGGPDDHAITRNPGKRHAWALPDAAPAPDEASTAWTTGETKEQ